MLSPDLHNKIKTNKCSAFARFCWGESVPEKLGRIYNQLRNGGRESL